MFKLAWDFFLSFTIRAVFSLVLFGGAYFLLWTWRQWDCTEWADQPNKAYLSLALAGVTTLVGLAGTFRGGKTEARFSMSQLSAGVTGASGGLPGGLVVLRVGSPDGPADVRTLTAR